MVATSSVLRAVKSIVAASSLLPAGAPQEEQKRTALASSVPQEKHFAMIFPATGYLRPDPTPDPIV
jgi:hypothetical protein